MLPIIKQAFTLLGLRNAKIPRIPEIKERKIPIKNAFNTIFIMVAVEIELPVPINTRVFVKNINIGLTIIIKILVINNVYEDFFTSSLLIYHRCFACLELKNTYKEKDEHGTSYSGKLYLFYHHVYHFLSKPKILSFQF